MLADFLRKCDRPQLPLPSLGTTSNNMPRTQKSHTGRLGYRRRSALGCSPPFFGFLSELSTATQEDASGRGGTITVNTNSFRVNNGGLVNAQTTSALRGGDVTINANKFEATQGGRIFTTATNQGQAGNITLNADTINLSGRNQRSTSGLFANTTSTAFARGGNIQVNARQLNVSDRPNYSYIFTTLVRT